MSTPALDLRTRRMAVVNEHIQAEAVQHDVSAVLATFHHPRYEVPAMGSAVDGGAAVHDLLAQLLSAFPDFWVEPSAIYHADDAVILELRFGGTQRGTWAGISATGKPFTVPAACIFLFEGDKLVCEKVYFDHATLLRQLGQD